MSMTFEELLLSALSRADEEPGDEIIDKVAEDSINLGYRKIATSVDVQIKEEVIKYKRSGYRLPSDCYGIAQLIDGNVRLSQKDYVMEGNVLYIYNKDYDKEDREFLLRYVFFPPKLINNDDKPITSSDFDLLITLFGAYHILIYKKRYSMAEMVKVEFEQISGGENINEL